MPRHHTHGATPLFLELDSKLVTRLKEFAEKNRRTVKAEISFAIEKLLEYYECRSNASGEKTASGPSDTLGHGDTPFGGAMPSPRSVKGRAKMPQSAKRQIEIAPADVYQKLLAKLKDPTLCAIAGHLRLGLPLQEVIERNIADGNANDENEMIEKIRTINSALSALVPVR